MTLRARPDLSLELRLHAAGTVPVAGIDEVGRGPLAGPVTAAAVVLDPGDVPEGIDDSKRLSPAARLALSVELQSRAEVAIAHAEVEEIADLNILYAAHLAMCRAVARLPRALRHALVDGDRVPPALTCRADAVVRGDALSLSIAAASIVAKVARDRIMAELDRLHPGYGWCTNVGYATPEHLSALQRLGVTPHHRRQFRPVHNILYSDSQLNT